jgi:large subunit ribosomal protein L25
MVLNNLETVMIEATPDKLPSVLEYNGEKLVEVGDNVTVADLIIPAGVELKVEPTHSVATVYEPSAVAAANDAAGGDAEPEDAENVEATAESDSGDSEKTDESAQKTES